MKLFVPTKELRRKFITKQKSFQCIGLQKFPLSTKEMQLQVNFIVVREQLQTLTKTRKELEVNTQMQDNQNMLLKTLSGILTERKMSL